MVFGWPFSANTVIALRLAELCTSDKGAPLLQLVSAASMMVSLSLTKQVRCRRVIKQENTAYRAGALALVLVDLCRGLDKRRSTCVVHRREVACKTASVECTVYPSWVQRWLPQSQPPATWLRRPWTLNNRSINELIVMKNYKHFLDQTFIKKRWRIGTKHKDKETCRSCLEYKLFFVDIIYRP